MIGEAVTRQRAGSTTDRYGNTVADWSSPSETTIAGCALAPVLSDEETAQARQGVVIGWTLFTPPGADIEPTDRIVARGDTYEIDGDPADWRSPHSGAPAGLELALKRIEG